MIKEEVKGIIEEGTYQCPIPSKDISECIDRIPTHDTVPTVRKVIRELIKDGCPIGSNREGYFLIRNREELESALESLQSRCDKIQERITNIINAYHKCMHSRHLNLNYHLKDRCRFYVIYLAESTGIPYRAIWTMAYRRLQKETGVDLVNLPAWYKGSVLNYCKNNNILHELYSVLYAMEGDLI